MLRDAGSVGHILLIDADDRARADLAMELEARGVTVVAAGDASAALERVAATRVRPDAAVLDPAARGLHRMTFEVPVVILADDDVEAPIQARVRALLARSTGPDLLLRVLEALVRGEPPPAPARVALGTARALAPLPPVGGTIDLHELARAKLEQYLDPRRVREVMERLLAEVGLGRIESTGDLRRFAGALQALGAVEAAVAVLLIGRATLLEAEAARRRK